MDEVYDSKEIYDQIKELVICKDATSVFYHETVIMKKRHNTEALVCYENNSSKTIVGWARLVDTTTIKTHNPKLHFGVFVNPAYRKQGIASSLLNEAELIAKDKNRCLVVRPWDKASSSFFKKKHGYTLRIANGRYSRPT